MQVLVIEDSELDYQLLLATLAAQGIACEGRRVETAAQLREALSVCVWDLVVSDHCLPDFSSAEAFEIVRAVPLAPPFVIVSGMIGEDAAVAAMRRGVDDYLIKGRLARLGAAVRNAVAARRAREERAAAHAQLAESRRQLRQLSAQLQARIDEERGAIAREIHDEIGGTLTAVRHDLEAACREAGEAATPRIRRAIRELADAQLSAQRIMRNLRPPILDSGLVPALRWLVQEFRDRQGIAAEFRTNTEDVALDGPLAVALYRACQEGLTNVAKHAGAARVSVDLHADADMLSLELEDDGRGFNPRAPSRPGSLGLRGMAERARALGGSLDVSSQAGRTTLMLWIPLRQDAALEAA